MMPRTEIEQLKNKYKNVRNDKKEPNTVKDRLKDLFSKYPAGLTYNEVNELYKKEYGKVFNGTQLTKLKNEGFIKVVGTRKSSDNRNSCSIYKLSKG